MSGRLVNAPRGAVLVTGASTGIGRSTALMLAGAGFHVLAGVRKAGDGAALERDASGALTPVRIDVVSPADIARAAGEIATLVGEAGLVGLVNNAGVGISAPVEYLPVDDLRRLFEVNVVGQIAVTQAMLPLLRRARGRIVNLGSVGDRITIPFGGALCASKCAFASLTEALRMELRPWGIHVALIEPGSINTPAVDKVVADLERRTAALPPEGAARYAELLRGFTRRALEREKQGSAPEVVAAAVLHALTARKPKTRYPVGKDARLLTTLPRLVPDRWLDVLRLRLFGLPTAFGALLRG